MVHRVLGAAVVLSLVSLGSAYIGMRAGVRYRLHTLCCAMPASHNVVLSFTEALGLERRYYGQVLQDKWVVETVFPGVDNGVFLDVGSADGILYSNTKALEDRGWTGICIDPFPTNMDARRCQMFKDIVFSARGQAIGFAMAGIVGV